MRKTKKISTDILLGKLNLIQVIYDVPNPDILITKLDLKVWISEEN